MNTYVIHTVDKKVYVSNGETQLDAIKHLENHLNTVLIINNTYLVTEIIK